MIVLAVGALLVAWTAPRMLRRMLHHGVDPQVVLVAWFALVASTSLSLIASIMPVLVPGHGPAAAGVLPRLRRGEVQWPVAGVFGAAGAGAAFGGAAVNRLLPERALLGAFAALMLVVGVQLLRRQPEPHGACEAPGGRVN